MKLGTPALSAATQRSPQLAAHDSAAALSKFNQLTHHRIRMCELACDQTSDWIMVDPWEAIQPEYQPTAVVLDHIATEVNDVLGGIAPYEGAPRSEYKRAHISLLSGSDLLQTMSVSL